MDIISNPEVRHDFVLLFDVKDGNPNGDPDAGNMPRVDPETMHGLVTDVCIKRKVRNWIEGSVGDKPGYDIYVKHQGVLMKLHKQAYEEKGLKHTGVKQDRDTVKTARTYMCEKYYDVRMFGAVMSVEYNCGQVRGPLQLTFARSIDTVTPLDLSITRVAVTKENPKAKDGGEEDSGKVTEMGRKSIVPYGLYKGYGFFSPFFARDTGVTSQDLKLFWQALGNMWDLDHSASKGLMSCRGVYVFTHDKAEGNAPAHKLLEDRIKVVKKAGVEVPRSFGDYDVQVLKEGLPEGVTLTELYV